VHVAGGNGKLIRVTAVARVLPRYWDGRRLLRFLTGLAMLALAFTTPAPAPAPAPAAVSSVTAAETTVAVSESVPAPSDVRRWPATQPAEILVIVALGSLTLLIGATLRVRGQRAPPAI
jgi:hypothetical protein